MPKGKDNPLMTLQHRIGKRISPTCSWIEQLFEKTLVPICNYVFNRIKWCTLLICLLVYFACGCAICLVCNYSISVYTLVFLLLGSITFVSVLAEKEFIKRSNLVQADILGHSANYNHNKEIASLLANASTQWNITGKLLLKSTGTVFFFGIIGCMLLKNRPPVGVFLLFLSVYGIAVGFSMIGYHQYNALLGFVDDLAQKYEPSKKVICWMTKEQVSWIVSLAQLYDFMSAAFFTLGLLFIVACCGFCFHPAFGVLSSSSTGLAILLFVFWGKILYELIAKYIYQLYIGKKNLSILADRIKDSHLSQVQSAFGSVIRTAEDYTGYNLYLQLKSLEIIPARNTVTKMVRGISSAASFIVTISSLLTIFQTIQAQFV
ncbi:MAG: hypothetical protein J1E40_08815 [Oscillospiraceae bacterium]|nr:hypothetical protein [Oscillospiraceae bacterium]